MQLHTFQLAAFVFGLALAQAFPEPRQRPSVIVDTDAGTDDLMALSYLLAGGEADLKAITAVNGIAHAEQGARNLLDKSERLRSLQEHACTSCLSSIISH